jgi:hypothetical protein
MYRTVQKTVNRLAKCTLKYVTNYLLLTEFTKIVRNQILHVGSEVLTAAVMKSSIFWDIMQALYLRR